MKDALGLVNPVFSPALERVAREENLGRDHPRRQPEKKRGRIREDRRHAGDSPDHTEEAMTSLSSTHIDLRV